MAETTSTFDPARFRMGEEASMVGVSETNTTTGLTANEIVDPYKQILFESMNATNYDLIALEAELAAEQALLDAAIAESEALSIEADIAASEAEAALAEGDKIVGELFFGNPQYNVSNFPSAFKDVVSKGLFGNNPAYTALYSMLSSIGVEGLVDVMDKIRTQFPEISSDEMLMLLKYDKRYNEPYLQRFEGNRKRIAAGLAPLDDATYLANEAAYKKIFDAYGLTQFNARDRYANFIGNNISPDEVASRVQLVYERVNTAMPEVKKALLQFYPELTTQDLMAYTLDPTNQLPAITRKIQAAEIGGAALAQQLSTSLTAQEFTGAQGAGYSNVQRGTIGVEAMLQAGATAETAARASKYVATVLPTAEKLSSIYGAGYDQYGQMQAEQEAYQGLASAERARRALSLREVAEFSGASGRSAAGLRQARTTGQL